MFGDYFLDQCITACCTLDDKSLNNKEIFSSVYEVMSWYRNEIPRDDYSVEFKNKLDFVFFISNYRSSCKCFNLDEFKDNISRGKFADLVPILDTVKDKQLSSNETKTFKAKVANKLKVCRLMDGKKNLQDFLDVVDTEDYVDEVDIIEKWETTLFDLYSNYMKIKSSETIKDAGYLDLLNDDYEHVIKKIKESTDTERTIKTGYKFIDDSLICKGLEERRLYLTGGESGIGKSTFLINVLCNDIISEKKKKSDRKEINNYLYITAENLIDESLLRFYCCLSGNDITETIAGVQKDELDLKKEICDILRESKCNVIFKYIPKGTHCKELELMIENISQMDGYKFHLFILDYLDLVNSGNPLVSSDLRLDLGEVSKWLKNCSVNYSIPVLTATQLNREGYNKKSAPALTQMGESMHKVNESDFVLFLQNSEDSTYVDVSSGNIEYKRIRATVLKNRNGRVGDNDTLMLCEGKGNQPFFNFRIEESKKIINSSSFMPTPPIESNDYTSPQAEYFYSDGNAELPPPPPGPLYVKDNNEVFDSWMP